MIKKHKKYYKNTPLKLTSANIYKIYTKIYNISTNTRRRGQAPAAAAAARPEAVEPEAVEPEAVGSSLGKMQIL